MVDTDRVTEADVSVDEVTTTGLETEEACAIVADGRVSEAAVVLLKVNEGAAGPAGVTGIDAVVRPCDNVRAPEIMKHRVSVYLDTKLK